MVLRHPSHTWALQSVQVRNKENENLTYYGQEAMAIINAADGSDEDMGDYWVVLRGEFGPGNIVEGRVIHGTYELVSTEGGFGEKCIPFEYIAHIPRGRRSMIEERLYYGPGRGEG